MDYSSLKTALTSLADNADTEVTGYIDTAIDMVESRFNNILRTRQMAGRWLVNIDAEYVTLPPDFLEMRRAHTTYNGQKRTLEYYTPDQVVRFAPYAPDIPTGYTIVGNLLQLYPEPNAAYDVEVAYYKRITALDDTNTTNWLIEDYPQIYLNGSMVELHKLLFDEERAQAYEGMFGQALIALDKSDTKALHSGAPLLGRLS